MCPAGYYVASALCFAALFRASTADPGRLLTDPHIPQSGVETGSASSINLVKVSSRAVRVLTVVVFPRQSGSTGSCATSAISCAPNAPTTAADAATACARWTTTVPGEQAASRAHAHLMERNCQDFSQTSFLKGVSSKSCCAVTTRINNCVGEDNHWLFLQLCFYTQVLSLFTLVLDFCQYYYFQPLTSLDQVRPARIQKRF